MSGRRWSKSERAVLFQGIGVYGLAWFRQRVGDSYDPEHYEPGRSDASIRAQAWRMFGRGGLSRGAYTLARACQATGYSRSQLVRARDALAQKWHRMSLTGPYLIYEAQVDEMVSWLKLDYWSGKHRLYGCAWCGSTSSPHRGQGLCVRCFDCYAHLLYRMGWPVACDELLEVLRQLQVGGPEVVKCLERGRAPDQLAIIRVIRGARRCRCN